MRGCSRERWDENAGLKGRGWRYEKYEKPNEQDKETTGNKESKERRLDDWYRPRGPVEPVLRD